MTYNYSRHFTISDGPAYTTMANFADNLTYRGRVTHICVSKLTITGPDNGLSPGRRQAIIWTNAGILLIRTLGTNFSDILIKINTFSLKKMHLKMSSGRRQPSCLGLNVLTLVCLFTKRQRVSFVISSTMKFFPHATFENTNFRRAHYTDVMMSAMASQITGVSIVCSTVGSGADQRKYQSSVSLVFVRGIHRWISRTKASNERGKCFRWMTSSCTTYMYIPWSHRPSRIT